MAWCRWNGVSLMIRACENPLVFPYPRNLPCPLVSLNPRGCTLGGGWLITKWDDYPSGAVGTVFFTIRASENPLVSLNKAGY